MKVKSIVLAIFKKNISVTSGIYLFLYKDENYHFCKYESRNVLRLFIS